MKCIKAMITVVLPAVLVIGMNVRAVVADDNAIFGLNSDVVEPNILIVFDNSGSMDTTAVSDCRRECLDERCESWGECDAWEEQCYQRRINGKWVKVCQDVCVSRPCNDWVCAKWKTVCENKTRMAVAQETVRDIIDRYGDSNRFGIMIFHDNTSDASNGGFFAEYRGKYPVCEVKDTFILDDSGRLKTGVAYTEAITLYKNYLKEFVDTLTPRTYTPLAETLAEAGRYFAEAKSWFNTGTDTYPKSGRYPDALVDAYNPAADHPPIEYRCRKNYIILMTDGEPTRDDSPVLKEKYLNGDYIAGGGLPALDDVAGFLHDHDINANFDTPDFAQNIMVYAIGFQGGDTALLQDTADRGTGAGDNKNVDDGGLYFNATSPEDLDKAFETIMFNISERRTMFAAPVVPVSSSSNAYAGDHVYLAMFQPSADGGWAGNLKKYSLNQYDELASCGTQTPILDETGRIKDSARSCWSDISDGYAVDRGGAGEKLSQRTDGSRHVYANISSFSDLTLTINAFSKDNQALTAEDFGVADKALLIDRVRRAGDTWRLGDFNHSRPLVAGYGSGPESATYVFAGSNDGMLHCFDDADGEEMWAFVPREQFGRLKELSSGDHVYFMDGSPAMAETDKGRKIIICGERRGGNHYYGLDVTDAGRPLFLYTHTTGGQSWKTPRFMRIVTEQVGAAEVFLVTGGYDPAVDNDLPGTRGRSVYTINAATGEKTGFYADSDDFDDMRCIVSASGLDMIDDGKCLTSEIYAADMAGHLYAFRDNNNPESPTSLDGDWQKMHLFSILSGGEKIFGDVDVVPEKIRVFNPPEEQWERVSGDYVYFGTGDRANPLRTDRVNRFYCIKNDWRTGLLTVTGIVAEYPTLDDDPGSDPDGNDGDPVILDVSDNKIQDGTVEEQLEIRQALEADYNRGWFITLDHPGEKCLSTPVVFDGVVYFTTYTPSLEEANGTDPCAGNNPGSGVSRLYALDYKTGTAVYDFGGDEKLDKEDRFTPVLEDLVSIAPSPMIFISDRGPKLIVGPHSEDPKADLEEVRKFYWKIHE
jgi:type IV pilus assembly protein PilY1